MPARAFLLLGRMVEDGNWFEVPLPDGGILCAGGTVGGAGLFVVGVWSTSNVAVCWLSG